MLSEEGRKRTAQAAGGLLALECAPERILSSPLARAAETAEIVRRALRGPGVEVADELRPGTGPDACARWLAGLDGDSFLLVGHAPDLPMLASALLAGQGVVDVLLKKAAVCRITFEGEIAPGRGTLEWLLQPGMLRRLGG
jgi:phosphohistidine phosphatase